MPPPKNGVFAMAINVSSISTGRFVVEFDRQRQRAQPFQLEHRCGGVSEASTRPPQSIGARVDVAREAERAHRHDDALIAAVQLAYAQYIDRDLIEQRGADGAGHVRRDGQAARDVVAGAGGHDAERQRRVHGGLRRMVDEAVATDEQHALLAGDDQLAEPFGDLVGGAGREVLG